MPIASGSARNSAERGPPFSLQRPPSCQKRSFLRTLGRIRVLRRDLDLSLNTITEEGIIVFTADRIDASSHSHRARTGNAQRKNRHAPIHCFAGSVADCSDVLARAFTVQAADTAQTSQAMTTRDWWPNVLDLSPLRQHDQGANPYGADSDYANEFKSLDLIAAEG